MDTKLSSLTLQQLLINPTGPNSAFMASRARIIEDLNNRYASLISKSKTFKFKVYRKKDDYYFVFKIPSEKYTNELFYDVVIHFVSNDETKLEKSLRNYTLRLFSNSPAFTFTYTYVLNKNNMLVEIMKPKCSKEALTMPPSIKNPVETYGFEKSCYFACRFIQENNLLNKFELNNNVFLFSESNIRKGVSSDRAKLQEYNLIKSSKKKGKNSTVKQKVSTTSMTTVDKYKRKKPITKKGTKVKKSPKMKKK